MGQHVDKERMETKRRQTNEGYYQSSHNPETTQPKYELHHQLYTCQKPQERAHQ